MKIYLTLFFVLLFVACSGPDSKNSNNAEVSSDTSEVVNAPLGSPVGEGVFRASGIVAVFFEPSNQGKLDRKKNGASNIDKAIAEFRTWKSEVEPILRGNGISFYSTDKDRLMLEVTNKSRRTVNLFSLQNPCGLILTAQGKEHLIINENIAIEELERQIAVYYGK